VPDLWQKRVELLTGDCREILAALPAESVQCCVTSPPYWGLRDYGLAPSVWGGEPTCEHRWGGRLQRSGGSQKQGESSQRKNRANVKAQEKKPECGQFCTRCGAWRGCLGLEPTPDLFIAHLVEIFRAVRRVLRPDGVLWLNLGDSYCNAGSRNQGMGLNGKRRGGMANTDGSWASAKANHGDVRHRLKGSGIKHKDLVGIPWRVAFALQADGWWLRSALPWVKRSAMPESATDRPNSALEYVFLLTKSARYFFDMEAVRVRLAEATFERDQYTRILDNDGPQAVRHDHETQANPAGRHLRNADLWFQSLAEPHGMTFLGDEPVGLDVNPAGFADAHFATFPEWLVEPLVKAGTSEKGCCAECGKPWVRVVQRSGGTTGQSWHDHSRDGEVGMSQASWPGGVGASKNAEGKAYEVRTTAWRPACKCRADPVPCTVLDPFSGAGTVALVAARLGRRAVGIEAKAEYNAMAARRIGKALSPATFVDESMSADAAPLFAGVAHV